MATHADILVSFIDELRNFERRLRSFTKENQAQTQRARLHISDTHAQINGEALDGPIRKNGTFLP